MRRLVGLSSRRLFRLWLISLGVTLLVGLTLLSMTQPQGAGAVARPALPTPTPTHTPTPTATPTPKPTPTPTPRPTATPKPKPTATPRPTATPQPAPTAVQTPAATPVLANVATPAPTTPTPRVTTTPGVDPPQTGSKVAPAPSWLVEGLVILFLILLGFSLIIFPIAVRSSRIDRRSRPAFSPSPVAEEEQVARLSLISPKRQEPLSRDQLQTLHNTARKSSDVSQQSTTSLAAVRLVNGVPITMPITEAETIPQLPAPRRPSLPRVIDGSAREIASEGKD